MPVYSYECAKGHTFDEFRLVDDRDKDTRCPKCKAKTHRVMTGCYIAPMFRPYVNYNLDSTPIQINTKRQERYEYAKRNCRKA